MSTSSNKPKDSAYWQQRLPAWSPVMTPLKIIVVMLSIGASFIPTGLYLMSSTNSLFEKTIVYDAPSGTTMDVSCSISSSNVNLTCPISVTLTQDVTGPIYVYYELTNFYQNQRTYANNFYYWQMQGNYVAADDSYLISACTPLVKNGTQVRNPCGLIAASYFTDVISLQSGSSSPSTVAMDESNIAWAYDRTYSFLQPQGFQKAGPYSTAQTCTSIGLNSACKTYKKAGQFYYYYYPNDDTTYYLHEMYPSLISPLEGVTNEHFIVWMKSAALPTFRKLWGKVSRAGGSSYNFKKGDVLTFYVQANYFVNSFKGSKALVLTTLNSLGMVNSNIGLAYLVCGCLCGFLGLLFTFVQLVMPRHVGSPEMFKWE